MINNRKSPISDKEIEEYLKTKELNLTATTDKAKAYKDAEYIIIATPTDYDPDKNYFNTKSVESVITKCIRNEPRCGYDNKIDSTSWIHKRSKEIQHTKHNILTRSF